MLNAIADLPSGVLGFEVEGKLEAADFRETLRPALDEAAEDGEIRVVIVIPTFGGLSPSAVWEDTKTGLKHWGAWKRAAFVTDIEWMAHATHWFGWMSPGEIKRFPLAEREAAIAWVAEK